jgi:hypothetical protein
MSGRPVALALSLLLTGSPVVDPSDTTFVEWARSRVVPIDPAGRAFRTLDNGIAEARLIGVGESVHEAEPFLSFRFQLLQDLGRTSCRSRARVPPRSTRGFPGNG